jgi:hypothetical protein
MAGTLLEISCPTDTKKLLKVFAISEGSDDIEPFALILSTVSDFVFLPRISLRVSFKQYPDPYLIEYKIFSRIRIRIFIRKNYFRIRIQAALDPI